MVATVRSSLPAVHENSTWKRESIWFWDVLGTLFEPAQSGFVECILEAAVGSTALYIDLYVVVSGVSR